MNRENTNKKRNEKGFTMIELIIVIALMGIIGAVLVPMFGNMSEKARISTDVATIKTLQRQLDIYKAENGAYPTGFKKEEKLATSVIEKLKDVYIESKDIDATGKLKLQTKGADIFVAEVGDSGLRCQLEVPDVLYTKLKLAENDDYKAWVKSVSGVSEDEDEDE